MPDQPAPAGTAPAIRVLPTADAVSAAAATFVADHLAAAIAARGVAHWSTTGGSAAPGFYRALRVPPLRDEVDWSRVHVWWGDDRFVPADHPLSNVLPFDQGLLASGGDDSGSDTAGGSGVVIAQSQVHPVPAAEAIGRGEGPTWAAARYAAEIAAHGPAPDASGVPVFDLVVLGVGPDGHVLSVFPGSAVWDAPGLCAAVPAPTHVEPHVERVTMHPRVLAAARAVLVVAAGTSKADVLGRALAGGDVRELPVRATMTPNATWLLDGAAAARLR